MSARSAATVTARRESRTLVFLRLLDLRSSLRKSAKSAGASFVPSATSHPARVHICGSADSAVRKQISSPALALPLPLLSLSFALTRSASSPAMRASRASALAFFILILDSCFTVSAFSMFVRRWPLASSRSLAC